MGKVEATLYLRYVWMFIDLATETVHAVFRFLTHPDDVLTFLTSHEAKQHIDTLKKRKVLDKTAYKKVTKELPNQFDLTLLITLIINLMNEDKLKPPDKGWDHPPKPKDDSLGADLLRLRKIRNVMVAHSPKAELEKHQFDEEWAELRLILLRIQTKIAPENEQEFKKKIEYYHREPIGPDTSQRISEQINEWKVIILEVQTKVDELLKVITDFDLYFNTPPNHRYGQYICLLDKGGRFVLSSYLKLKIEESGTELQEILRRNESTLQKEIKDRKQLALINTASTSNSVDRELNISSLAIVILHSLKNADEEIRQDVEYIKTAHETYAEIRVKTLDIDETLDDALLELKVSLKFVAKFLPKSQRDELNKITEECKHPENQQRQTALDNLKSEGIKTLKYVYNDIKEKTKTLLQKMTSENILFGSEKVLELKMITCGTSEEKTRLAERILIEVWQEALERTDNQERFTSIEEHVHNILNEIKKIKGITMTKIEQRCILISVSSTTPMALMDAVKYFESEPFLETMSKIMIEIGYHFDTVFRIHSCLTMESLYEILTCNKVAHENKANSARLLINVSTPESMMKVLSLPYNEQVTKSIKAIAESLSSRMNEKIQFDLCLDGLDNDFAQDGRDLSSSEESSDNEQPFEVDISLNDNVDERLHENESKSLNTEANLIVKDNKGIKGIESERDSTSTEYKPLKQPAMSCVSGAVLDVSGSMKYNYGSYSDTEGGKWVGALFDVIDDLITYDVTSNNKVFAFGAGANRMPSQAFDMIKAIKLTRDEDLSGIRSSDAKFETIDRVFDVLERSGAKHIRKWAEKDKVSTEIKEGEARLVLKQLTDDKGFRNTFVNEYLPSSCRDWVDEKDDSWFGYLKNQIQRAQSSAVSTFKQANEEDIRRVTEQAISYLLCANRNSVYPADEAAEIVRGTGKTKNKISPERSKELHGKIEPYIYGATPLFSALTEAVKSFPDFEEKEEKINYLFVFSDGEPSDYGNVGTIKSMFERKHIKVICCYISTEPFPTIKPKQLYSIANPNWDMGARILFQLSSTIPSDTVPRAILSHAGWDIDLTDDATRLFIHVNSPENMTSAVEAMRKAVSSEDCLLNLVADVSIEMYIKEKTDDFQTPQQKGKTCYANAAATVMHLAMLRIHDRDGGYPEFETLRMKMIEEFREEGADTLEVLKKLCPKYRLRCKTIDSKAALKAVSEKRPVIARFALSKIGWRLFDEFFRNTPYGTLSKQDMEIPYCNTASFEESHAVVLTGYNSKSLRLMNFKGEKWGNHGFFRIENAEVLGLDFIDVFWEKEDLSDGERERYSSFGSAVTHKLVSKLNGIKEGTYTCPNCRQESKIKNFHGTFSEAVCPECMGKFQCKDGNGNLIAMSIYLSSLNN